MFELPCRSLTLVLEEDGTAVDSDEFFQSLASNRPLMVLEEGEVWTRSEVRVHCSREGTQEK